MAGTRHEHVKGFGERTEVRREPSRARVFHATYVTNQATLRGNVGSGRRRFSMLKSERFNTKPSPCFSTPTSSVRSFRPLSQVGLLPLQPGDQRFVMYRGAICSEFATEG